MLYGFYMKKLMMTIMHDIMKTIMDMIKMRKSDAPITTNVFKILRIILLVVDCYLLFFLFLSSFLYEWRVARFLTDHPPPQLTKNVPYLLLISQMRMID